MTLLYKAYSEWHAPQPFYEQTHKALPFILYIIKHQYELSHMDFRCFSSNADYIQSVGRYRHNGRPGGGRTGIDLHS